MKSETETAMDPDTVKKGVKTLGNLFIHGDCAHSTVLGPDCAGIGSVRCIYQGGKLVVSADTVELLSFYG